MCWPIVFPVSGALRNVQKGCIPEAVRTILLALNYPQWYTILNVVSLVTQGPRSLPDTVSRDEVLT